MQKFHDLFSPPISAYEILYGPWDRIKIPLGVLFANFFPSGFPDFSSGALPGAHTIYVLRRVKSLGYFPQFLPHPDRQLFLCRLLHSHERIQFEAPGQSREEAVLRASALAFLAHQVRKTA